MSPMIQLEDESGLILLYGSGVSYTHQSGGYACRHPIAEGVFSPIPLGVDASLLAFVEDISEVFTGEKWAGWCCDQIDTETADQVDVLFEQVVGCRAMRVNRQRMQESYEAWVYLTIGQCQRTDCPCCTFSGFPDEQEAILIWPNSD